MWNLNAGCENRNGKCTRPLGESYGVMEEVWKTHTDAEFPRHDVEAALATMTDNAFVLNSMKYTTHSHTQEKWTGFYPEFHPRTERTRSRSLRWFHFGGGKICGEKIYWDGAKVSEQVGVPARDQKTKPVLRPHPAIYLLTHLLRAHIILVASIVCGELRAPHWDISNTFQPLVTVS
jgi:hypothetical protein